MSSGNFVVDNTGFFSNYNAHCVEATPVFSLQLKAIAYGALVEAYLV